MGLLRILGVLGGAWGRREIREEAMTVRVGIIGSGGMGNAHKNALAKVEGAQLVAAADVDLARAEKILDGRGKAYDDFRKMLAAEKLDAAYVCTPPHAHGEIELACAEHVGAVMVEKPVGNDLEQCREDRGRVREGGHHRGCRLYEPLPPVVRAREGAPLRPR